jgi:hypothetical protein
MLVPITTDELVLVTWQDSTGGAPKPAGASTMHDVMIALFYVCLIFSPVLVATLSRVDD